MLFSIIIPVYNSEKFIDDTISSVLAQAHHDFEIICIDDCSDDNSYTVLEKHSKKDTRIKVIKLNKNSGVSIARNEGIRNADGEYILFLDSDDRLLEGSLNRIETLIRQDSEPDLIVGKYIVIPDENYPSFESMFKESESTRILDHINDFKSYNSVCWFYIYNKKFIDDYGLYFKEARIFEDTEFTARVLCRPSKFTFMSEPFYCHRKREGSLGRSISSNDSLSGIKMMIELAELYRQPGLERTQLNFVLGRIENIASVFIPMMISNDKKQVKKISDLIRDSPYCIHIFKKIKKLKMFIEYLSMEDTEEGITLFQEKVINYLTSRFNSIRDHNIYLACASIFSEGVARVMKKEGYNLAGFFDNNKALHNTSLYNLKVTLPSQKYFAEDNFIIICNESTSVCDSITWQLLSLGVLKSNIASITNLW